MKKYRKKPVVIEAAQWDGTEAGAGPILNWILEQRGDREARYRDPADSEIPAMIAIDTLEGTMAAHAGDFIIQGVAGEFYPCRADIFEATYEEAT